MNICGIVAEYNPFHNGHGYHIEKARENGATHIVAVMSGNFTQRGDIAVYDKFTRAGLAVKNGADLVIELPVAYSLSTAELFARGAISLLGRLGCVDSLSFGCECDDLYMLETAASASAEISNSDELKEMLKTGMGYPATMQKLAGEKYGDKVAEMFSTPNNVLGIEYMKQIHYQKLKFGIIPVKRTGTMHDSNIISDSIASASEIRRMIDENEDYGKYVPYNKINGRDWDYIQKTGLVFLYRLRSMTKEEIRDLPDVSEELAGRIYAASRNETDMAGLMSAIMTKRYTAARIRRILFCALLGIKKENTAENPPYARVLALNKRGAEILKKAKETAVIPIDTSLARLMEKSSVCAEFAETENKATDIYMLLSGKRETGSDMTQKIEITENVDEL